MGRKKIFRYKMTAKDVEDPITELENPNKIKVDSPLAVYNNFKYLFEPEEIEKLAIIRLTPANVVMGLEIIPEQEITDLIIFPFNAFRKAIENSCHKIIIVQNHSNGYVEPWASDVTLAYKLRKYGRKFDVKLLDHIIFTDDDFYSFEEREWSL